MNIIALRKSDNKRLVLFHIDGNNGYCKDKDGNILVEALTGLKISPLHDGSGAISYSRDSLLFRHLNTTEIIIPENS